MKIPLPDIDKKDVAILASFGTMLAGIARLSVTWALIIGGALPLALLLLPILRTRR